jgi:exodeoxyribonuclease VII large subunit
VVSAIGHETDVTIADYVADVRAPTPSAAAELVAPDRDELTDRLSRLREGLDRGFRDVLRDGAARLATIAERLTLKGLRRDVDANMDRLASAGRSLAVSIRTTIAREGERLEAVARRLDVLSPLATLRRGYAVLSRGDGALLAWACETTPGESVVVRLQDGRLRARIERTEVA